MQINAERTVTLKIIEVDRSLLKQTTLASDERGTNLSSERQKIGPSAVLQQHTLAYLSDRVEGRNRKIQEENKKYRSCVGPNAGLEIY